MPNCVYHVMARGNGGQAIVRDDGEFFRLLDVIGKVKASSDFDLYAYCLMTNHFHALIRVNADPIEHFMQRIQTAWAVRFNLTRDRHGHVFQGRFKSKSCGDDTDYCRWLLRYIHVNPVNAGIVKRPEHWLWSSYRQYLGLSDGIADIDWPLSLFDGGMRTFRPFVLQGIGELREPSSMEDSRAPNEVPDIDRSDDRADRASVRELADGIAAECGISVQALLGPSRSRSISAARRLLVRRALSRGYRGSELARDLRLSMAAISRMLAGNRIVQGKS